MKFVRDWCDPDVGGGAYQRCRRPIFLKSLNDALSIRERVLGAYEWADRRWIGAEAARNGSFTLTGFPAWLAWSLVHLRVTKKPVSQGPRLAVGQAICYPPPTSEPVAHSAVVAELVDAQR